MLKPPPTPSLLGIFAKHAAAFAAKKICQQIAPRLRQRPISRQDLGPYMVRHYLGEGPSDDQDVGVFLHKFVGDDDPGIVHNHPWTWCASVILSGAYCETRYKWATKGTRHTLYLADSPPQIDSVRLYDKTTRILSPFDVNVIRHDDMHRVSLIDKECWTLFIHGPRVSTWGFADEASGKFTEVINNIRQERREAI